METFTDSFGQTLLGVHSPDECRGPACTIHRPSSHHMRDWPLHYRFDRGIFERICLHGVGHPDPDSLGDGVHGCCGCCRNPFPMPPGVDPQAVG